jgi:uncharacterized protein (UPF0332 family)
MNPELKECLENKNIIPFPQGKKLIHKELSSAREDLEDARFGLAHGKYKWPTIQGYSSMHHASRALLFSQGYREKNHYCLLIAIRALFVERRILEIDHLEALYSAMILKENADYESDFSQPGAALVLKNAEGFLRKAEEILKSR